MILICQNARLYSELTLALPRELNREQQLNLVHKFVEKELGKHHVYTIVR
ncbi:MAG: MobA/MobL family protein [Merismopedia sp. SIO2A8]|nr:MobA/MobL family protein [Symploca sp. SIO2B6]NET50711.1 MobA/MobL family protein [Merismopedia sp. SIO2A8]